MVQLKKALALIQCQSCSLTLALQDAPAWRDLFAMKETVSMSQTVQVCLTSDWYLVAGLHSNILLRILLLAIYLCAYKLVIILLKSILPLISAVTVHFQCSSYSVKEGDGICLPLKASGNLNRVFEVTMNLETQFAAGWLSCI